MSKNPFPTLIAQHYPDLVRPESCKGWALALEDGTKFENATPEQIQYAAEAINSHDALVRQRDKAKGMIKGLLLSADAMWESNGEGHDWDVACREARELLAEIEKEENRDEH